MTILVMMNTTGINRIRLEFKDEIQVYFVRSSFCINRIRLEFKVWRVTFSIAVGNGINRIRLEFKDGNWHMTHGMRPRY